MAVKEGTDIKTLGAGAGIGGGLATVVVSLLASNIGANTKQIQAEIKITSEMVNQVSLRMDRYEERAEKKNDQFEDKQDKILEAVSLGTRDRFTKLDQEKYALKVESRIEKLEDSIRRFSEKLTYEMKVRENRTNKGERRE